MSAPSSDPRIADWIAAQLATAPPMSDRQVEQVARILARIRSRAGAR